MKITETSIPGLLYISDIAIFTDERGSFRTPFRSDMPHKSLKQFANQQWNISENEPGTTRGIHAEPWDKFVHIIFGRAFAAIVDLRVMKWGQVPFDPISYVETFELNKTNALLVPSGCGNSFQALEFTIYAYLTSDLWSADNKYSAVSLDDPSFAIDWPMKDPDRIISDKDRSLKTVLETYGVIGS